MKAITNFLGSKGFMTIIIACAVAYGLHMVMKTITSISDTLKKVIPYAAAAAIILGFVIITKSKESK